MIDFFRFPHTPHLAWLVLTKRIGNVAGMAPAEGLPPNVWLGATIVTQEEADRDIPKLLHIPATVRFLSMEPLLEPVDLSSLLHLTVARNGAWQCNNKFHERRPEWIIVGGESGSKARPFNLHWARDIVAQCKAAGVRVHVKQLGAVVHADRGDSFLLRLRDKAGGDMAEWPEDLRVRQHPDHSF